MKKALLGVVVLAVLAVAIWQAQRRIAAAADATKKGRPDAPVAVETQPVRTGSIQDIGVFTGSLVPESQFVVAPKAAGWIKDLLVDIGDSVRRNDVIAVLNDEEFRRQVEQAGAELQVAKANAENTAAVLDLARREYERVMALREKQIASAAELDAASATYNAGQAQLKVAQAQVVQKEAALKAAELQLSYTQVRAFWEDGDANRVVGERFVDEGALVSVNQPIVSILENNPLTAVVFVVERDYPKMSVGQEAGVTTDAYPGEVFRGSIRRIAPLLRENSRQARVEIEIANPRQLLKPGMFIRARVEFARIEQATLVPITALVRRDGKQGVFLVESDGAQEPVLRARFVPVTTGIVSGEVAEVKEPALSGAVVTLGNHLLEDGAKVMLPKPPAEAAGNRAKEGAGR
ncbi:MAG: efflux RND transporter periplasmic adaptor subunit [Planctomycetes bacterium]|nr:efflux RND transporter periplasmic adaptor subunit [Planctomycetota bacterium]